MAVAMATAFLSFFVLFLLQVVLARVIKPKSEDKFIIFLYVVMPAAIFAVCWFFGFFHLISPKNAVLSYLLFFVIASSWVASYPAVYAVCPTLIMSWVIENNGSGTKLETLQDLLGLKRNSSERIEDAVHDRLICSDGNTVQLTLAGRVLLGFFMLYRKILGMELKTL